MTCLRDATDSLWGERGKNIIYRVGRGNSRFLQAGNGMINDTAIRYFTLFDRKLVQLVI